MPSSKPRRTGDDATPYIPCYFSATFSHFFICFIKVLALFFNGFQWFVDRWLILLEIIQDLNVTENPIAFTVTFSFAAFGKNPPGPLELNEIGHGI